jgi:hypothetical protein
MVCAKMTLLFRIAVAHLCVVGLFAPAMAMDFSVVRMPDGLRVVLANGEIIAGDADRLRVALQSADRDKFGNKNIALNSPGGSVEAALSIVKVMDQDRVTTIVPPKLICASACASIVFLAGVQRVVLDGGVLGMHTCSSGGEPSALCNDIIGQTAFEHGTPYGSVAAFMKYTGPKSMLWLDSKQADCYGYTRWPPGFDRGTKPGEIPPCVESVLRQQMGR